MKEMELIKIGTKYYLNYLNNKIELNTKWVGIDRPVVCRAVLSGLQQISQNEKTTILFEQIFSNPNALVNFSFQINSKTQQYDVKLHKNKIVAIAKLLKGIEREYFIESVVKLVSWVNTQKYWVNAHLHFDNEVVPRLIELIDKSVKMEVNHSEIRNLENTFVHDSSSLKIENDLIKIKLITEIGGRAIHVCCPSTIRILNEALDFELTDLEFNVFVESFNRHPLSGFAYNEFRINNKLKVNISKLMAKIETTANLFKNPEIKSHFLKSLFDDAQLTNQSSDWAPTLLHFNNVFEERFNMSNSRGIERQNSYKLEYTNDSNDVSIAEKYLYFLNGKTLTNQKYLSGSDYQRLIRFVNTYFENLELPKNLQPIPSVHYKVGELRYAFYLMFKEMYPNVEYPKSLFQFLEITFPNLKDKENRDYRETANYKKFTSKPQYWDDLLKHNNKS